MADGEEIAEMFIGYPSLLTSNQKRDYEEIYHPNFQAILPSVKISSNIGRTLTFFSWF
jgi:hypothetical protein